MLMWSANVQHNTGDEERGSRDVDERKYLVHREQKLYLVTGILETEAIAVLRLYCFHSLRVVNNKRPSVTPPL